MEKLTHYGLSLMVIVLLIVGLSACGSGQSAQVSGEAASGSAASEFEAGNQYFQAGQLDEAITAYKRTIELDPNYQAAYVNLGVAYYQQEKFDLAEAQYRKALELNPNDGEVAYNLGALYLQQALVKGDPVDSAAFERAIEQLEQASRLMPDLAEPHFSLGVAYQRLGETEKAIQSFETFLDQTPQDPTAIQEARRYLNELQAEE